MRGPLGKLIDEAYRLRLRRLAFERKTEQEVAAMKEAEHAINEQIINMLDEQKTKSATGSVATGSKTKTVVAQVKDWRKLQTYIEKKHAWDLVQRRVNDKAYRDRLDAKEVVPGVEPFTVVKLSLTKIGE